MTVSVAPLISVAIPTYEMKGRGVAFLMRCLDSIAKQIGIHSSEIEIIISDQSSDKEIEGSLQQLTFPFTIRYTKVPSKKGVAAHNLNVAISRCQGKYVKILFQDDLLVEETYLQTLSKVMLSEHPQCILTSALHTIDGIHFTNPIIPSPNPYFLFGHNTVSSPSVVSLERHFAQMHPFDEKLKMLFDCDFYYRLFQEKTSIKMLSEIHIANGVWEGQAQHAIENHQMTLEVRHLHCKYPQANLLTLLPAYEQFFRELHPSAPFPFATNLEPSMMTLLQEKFQNHINNYILY